MKVYGLIPARAGSKGLPDKNIKKVGGHPLMAYAIAYGLRLNLDKLIVSTDSDKYAAIATQYGAECPYLRGPKASSDTAREEDILEELDGKLPILGIDLPDIWVWLKPTNPFRCLDAGRQAIEILSTDPEIDSVRVVSQADLRLQLINEKGFLEAVSSGWPDTLSKIPRTFLPAVYSPYNQEIFRHALWKKNGPRFMGEKIYPIVRPQITGIDIDDYDTFLLAKALIECTPRQEYIRRFTHLESDFVA